MSLLHRRIMELEAENAKLRSLLSLCKCNPDNEKLNVVISPPSSESDRPRISYTESSNDSTKALCNHVKRHVALKIMYFGKRFHGFASDGQTEPTVESELFKALKKTKLLIGDKKEAQYSRCGRTDKGVSSVGQVISLLLRSKIKQSDENNCKLKNIPFEENIGEEIDYPNMLNRVLPDDIRVLGWSPVSSDFSARFSCLSREYRYFCWKENLNIKAMENGGEKFLGEHDFRNFCKMDAANVHNYRRNITFFKISPFWKRLEDAQELFVITFKGSAFLWHQIRCMVAVLFMIGQGLESPNIIDILLDTERTPRKPQYKMASEIPLVLYNCEFQGMKFFCSPDAQRSLQSHLKSQCLAYQMEAAIYSEALNSSISFIRDEKDHSNKKGPSHLMLLSRPTEPSYNERRESIERTKLRKSSEE